MMSPLGDLQVIMDQTLMFLSMKQHPDALHRACDVITTTQEAVQEATLEAVGGEGRLAGLTNWPIWRPEGAKVLVTDDVAGSAQPAHLRGLRQALRRPAARAGTAAGCVTCAGRTRPSRST